MNQTEEKAMNQLCEELNKLPELYGDCEPGSHAWVANAGQLCYDILSLAHGVIPPPWTARLYKSVKGEDEVCHLEVIDTTEINAETETAAKDLAKETFEEFYFDDPDFNIDECELEVELRYEGREKF